MYNSLFWSKVDLIWPHFKQTKVKHFWIQCCQKSTEHPMLSKKLKNAWLTLILFTSAFTSQECVKIFLDHLDGLSWLHSMQTKMKLDFFFCIYNVIFFTPSFWSINKYRNGRKKKEKKPVEKNSMFLVRHNEPTS